MNDAASRQSVQGALDGWCCVSAATSAQRFVLARAVGALGTCGKPPGLCNPGARSSSAAKIKLEDLAVDLLGWPAGGNAKSPIVASYYPLLVDLAAALEALDRHLFLGLLAAHCSSPGLP